MYSNTEIINAKLNYEKHYSYYKIGEFEKAWEVFRDYTKIVENRGVNILDVYHYETILNRRIIEPIDIITSIGNSSLSKHTIENLSIFYLHLENRINEIYNEHGSYFNYFFGKKKINFNALNKSFIIKNKEKFEFNENTFESYKHHFYSLNEFKFKKRQLITHFQINYVPKDRFNCFLEAALIGRLKHIVREEEDYFRINLGLPKIGEGWISETELYRKIKIHFEEFEVIHHGKPKWLGRQHFDIWIPKLKLAIEYQGLQHDIPVNFFGGEISFESNKKRDENKRMLCIKNKCILIEVRPNYDFNELVNEINTKLKK